MEAKRINGNCWVLRIDRSEKIFASLEKFCRQKKISGGFFMESGRSILENRKKVKYG